MTAYAAALHDTHGIEVSQAAIVVAHLHGPAVEVIVSRAEMATLWEEWRERCAAFPGATAVAQQRDEQKRATITGAFTW